MKNAMGQKEVQNDPIVAIKLWPGCTGRKDKSKSMEQWDPRKLPPVRDPNRIPLSTSVTELTG
jgi:hypothetical protein